MPRPGETVLGGTFLTNLGGKGANQAVAAARAVQAPVTFVAAVGEDAYGREALITLAREINLSLDHVRTLNEQATGVALITVDAGGENMISVASVRERSARRRSRGANPRYCLARDSRVSCLPGKPAGHGRTGTPPRPAARRADNLESCAGFAEAGSGDLLKFVDVLTPNEVEAETLVGKAEGGISPVTSRQTLRERGAGAVIVTCGADGCHLVAANTSHLPALRVKAVDTTAAGDAFNGALAVALAEGKSLIESARWASAAAAISVMRPGAITSLASRAEIDNTLPRG